MARLIAIGDVHGEISLLRRLVDALELTPEDEPVMLGDLIDRGEDSRATLEFVMSLRELFPRLVVLRGNHEQMLLDAIDEVDEDAPYQWLHVGGDKTARDYDGRIPAAHIEYLRGLPLWYRSGDTVFVHAGLLPDVSVLEQLKRNDPEILLWERDHLKAGRREWEPGLRVVCGHTVQRAPLITEQVVCIDTGAPFGGGLTAIDLSNDLVYQARWGGAVNISTVSELREARERAALEYA